MHVQYLPERNHDHHLLCSQPIHYWSRHHKELMTAAVWPSLNGASESCLAMFELLAEHKKTSVFYGRRRLNHVFRDLNDFALIDLPQTHRNPLLPRGVLHYY